MVRLEEISSIIRDILVMNNLEYLPDAIGILILSFCLGQGSQWSTINQVCKTFIKWARDPRSHQYLKLIVKNDNTLNNSRKIPKPK